MIVDKSIEESVSIYDEINNKRTDKLFFFLHKMIILGFSYSSPDQIHLHENVNIYRQHIHVSLLNRWDFERHVPADRYSKSVHVR